MHDLHQITAPRMHTTYIYAYACIYVRVCVHMHIPHTWLSAGDMLRLLSISLSLLLAPLGLWFQKLREAWMHKQPAGVQNVVEQTNALGYDAITFAVRYQDAKQKYVFI